MSSHFWHYANRSGQQQGPIDASSLRAAFARGELDAGSLVWRDGLPQWVTLSDVAAELGINLGVMPPPVPGARPFANANPGTFAAPPVKKPMSGGTIALIVIAVGGVLLVPVAILAAIAIPAYQDYVAKAQFAEATMVAGSYKELVAAHHANAGTCPNDADINASGMQGKYVGRVEFPGGPAPCAITIVFADGEPTVAPLRGGRVSFLGTPTPDGMAWQCQSGLPDKYKPTACR